MDKINGESLHDIYLYTRNFLKKEGSSNPNQEAEIILAHLLSLNRAQFYLKMHDKWNEDLTAKLLEILNRYQENEPLQYIMGESDFYGWRFFVNQKVLIPRPETEILVERTKQIANRILAKQKITMVDIGTGSGIIAITLQLLNPDWRIFAVDISEEALSVARLNAKQYGVEGKITWIKSDLLSYFLTNNEKIDLLISNPPYIPQNELKGLAKRVKDYEPELALNGGTDGLDFYRKIVKQAFMLPTPPKLFAFEVGIGQAQAVQNLLRENGTKNEEIINDLNQIPRVVIGWRELVSNR